LFCHEQFTPPKTVSLAKQPFNRYAANNRGNNTMISKFSDLLDMATTQDEPQRLLFLFAQADGNNSAKSNKKKNKAQKGTITPVMCVDKLPQEIDSFDSLVSEADDINADWNFILVAGLSGKNGQAPSSDDADPYLNQMVNGLASGEDLSRYIIFDREQNPIMMQ